LSAQASIDALHSELQKLAGQCIWDPLKFVNAFWTDPDLEQFQVEVLEAIGEHFSNPKTRKTPCRIALCSGNGIGKSALLAMICGWAMSTCVDCRVQISANTMTQLKTKVVPEVTKWFRSLANSYWWKPEVLSIRSKLAIKGQSHSMTWRMDFIAWQKEKPEAIQGLHNAGKRIVIIFEEASGIPEAVWDAAEKLITDADTEVIFIAASNPTRPTGRFAELFGRLKHLWPLRWQIDSRTVRRTNKTLIANWIESYGEDSDFVRVSVKGEFPRSGVNQLIPQDVVARCRKFTSEGHHSLPKILSVDVARYGDDQSVIGQRQGRYFQTLKRMRGLSTVEVAERVIEQVRKDKPDAIVVDGDGIGAGVVDHLRFRGFDVFEFHGGESARDDNKYFNRRAECWGLAGDWLRAGAEIPDMAELEADLTGPMYGYNAKQQIQLERKEDMKARGLASPDLGDCLAMTFGVDIQPVEQKTIDQEYNPTGGFPDGYSRGGGWMAS
jgi:hypothetical protein